jgi:hypothetical protein
MCEFQHMFYAQLIIFLQRLRSHLGITPIYGSFVKPPCDCQPLQFQGHNFTAVRTSNLGSFVDMVTKLHTLAVTQRLFGPAGENQNC